jgi:hypothetical protein
MIEGKERTPTNGRPSGVALKARLVQETNALVNSAEHGSAVTASDVRRILRIQQLLEAHERMASSKTSHRNRWYFATAILVVIIAVSFLAATRVSHSRAHLKIETDAVQLQVAKPGVLGRRHLALRSILASEITTVSNPETDQQTPASSFDLVASGDVSNEKGIWIEPISVRSASKVQIEAGAIPHGIRAVIDQPTEIAVSVIYAGAVHRTTDAENGDSDFDIPSIDKLTSTERMQLLLAFADHNACVICRPVAIQRMNFDAIDRRDEGTNVVYETYSPVHSAEIRLQGVADVNYKLEERDTLVPNVVSGTVTRLLPMPSGTLMVEFEGELSGLSTGTGDDQRSLMPTRLEWLITHHSRATAWTVAVYLCGLMLAAARWWGVKV